jgi:hypothetical protein
MHLLAAPAAVPNRERYEVLKARVDLVEAEAEFDCAASDSDRRIALERVEDARARIYRWSWSADGDDARG